MRQQDGTQRSSEVTRPDSALELPRRRLGRTELEISVLGLGGFHQVEFAQEHVNAITRRFIQAGGNYIETAKGYGNGASEAKLGRALRPFPRDQYILATKTGANGADQAYADICASLERLQTDYLDLCFFHGVGSEKALDKICASDGALTAFSRARDEGLIRHMAVSSHWPEMYLRAADRLPVDAVLIWGNYLDFCNFPEIPNRVLPALREQDIGILLMKPFADGFLYRSPSLALRFALGQDADGVVSGFNSLELLETDLRICCDADEITDLELLETKAAARELGDYVCRQCPHCAVLPDADGAALKRVFELEGKCDRQMDDRRPVDPAHYALRERLKGWFGTADRARQLYAGLGQTAPELARRQLAPCLYGIDIPRKLAIAHAKLADPPSLSRL